MLQGPVRSVARPEPQRETTGRLYELYMPGISSLEVICLSGLCNPMTPVAPGPVVDGPVPLASPLTAYASLGTEQVLGVALHVLYLS